MADFCKHRSKIFRSLAVLAVSVLVFGTAPPAFAQSAVSLFNIGGDMGGHTPRGFRGQGNGIFVGDNLNAGFPNGEGVQAFISFDMAAVAGRNVSSAELSSQLLNVSGDPFTDLGPIRLEKVIFRQFSSVVWDFPTEAETGCVLAISPDQTSVGCDLTEAVRDAVQTGARLLQFRLRFEKVSDRDGQQDLALFYEFDSNANEGGVFEIVVR